MESSANGGYALVFDGPAAEERVHMVVPPTPVRWFCRSGEMGSDERMAWWTMEEPPQDDSVEITEYRLNPNVDSYEEDGDTVIEYTCDPDLWIREEEAESGPMGSAHEQLRRAIEGDPELAERLAAMGTQLADPHTIPRSSFAAEDVAAILVNGVWHEIPTPGKMFEVVLEPQDSPVKLSIGANLVYKDTNGEYVSIAPQAVHGFRFRPSSVARQPEVTAGIVRIARDTYDAGGAEVMQMIADADQVYVVEPDGEHTLEKDREGNAG